MRRAVASRVVALTRACSGSAGGVLNEPDRTLNTMQQEMPYVSGSNVHPEVHPAGGDDTLENPLPKEELAEHQQAEREWMEFSNAVVAARSEGDAKLLEVLDSGIALSRKQGADLRRPGYDASLHLEAAAVHRRAGDLAAAAQRMQLAEDECGTDRDIPGQMAARHQRAALQVIVGAIDEAHAAFDSVLEWCTTNKNTGTPMSQSKAQSLAPLCKLGLAQSKVKRSEFDSAFDLLGEVLPHFANLEDVERTWECLIVAEECFRGMNQPESVKKSIERQVNWAKRFKLDERIAESEKKLAEL